MFLVPIVSTVLVFADLVRSGWVPRNDRAFVQLRVLDVFSGDTPLVGMPSTLSGSSSDIAHHLGPGQFWALAVPLRVVSAATDSPASIGIASGLLTILAVVAVAWSVRSAGVEPLDGWLTCGFLCAALWQGVVTISASPWNPDFAYVALAAATAITALVATGRPTVSVCALAILLASCAAQAHLNYVFPAIALVGTTVVYGLRAECADRRRRWIGVIVTLTAVAWIGPILDVVLDSGGNIVAIFSADGDGGVGLLASIDRFARSLAPWELGLRQPLDGGRFAVAADWPTRVFAFAALWVVCLSARARGRQRHLAILTLVMVAATIVGGALAPDSLSTALGAHVQRVWILPTLLVWATVGLRVLGLLSPTTGWLRDHRPQVQRALAVVPMVGVLLAAAVFDRGQPPSSDPACSEAVTMLADELGGSADAAEVYDSSEIPFTGLGLAQDISTGVYAELVRRGSDLQLIAEAPAEMIGDRRFSTRSDRSARIVVSTVPPDLSIPRFTASCDTGSRSATLTAWIDTART